MKKIGIIDLDNPSSIEIYTGKSKNKKEIKRIIDHYNSDNKNKKIYYVDMMSVLLDTLSSMVNIISLVLESLIIYKYFKYVFSSSFKYNILFKKTILSVSSETIFSSPLF